MLQRCLKFKKLLKKKLMIPMITPTMIRMVMTLYENVTLSQITIIGMRKESAKATMMKYRYVRETFSKECLYVQKFRAT